MGFAGGTIVFGTLWTVIVAAARRLVFTRFFHSEGRLDVVFTAGSLLVLFFAAVAGLLHVTAPPGDGEIVEAEDRAGLGLATLLGAFCMAQAQEAGIIYYSVHSPGQLPSNLLRDSGFFTGAGQTGVDGLEDSV